MANNKRLNQLKFISSIFQMSLKEIKETLGFETLTMIFRRVGETAAERIVKRLEGKYTTIEEFGNILIKDVIEPIIGENKGNIIFEGNKIVIELEACPYKKAGNFPITEMEFFCHYTEGLFDTAFKLAFPDKQFYIEPKDLISKGCNSCVFETEMS
ncbi:MAG: hypothetical protein ACTSYI_01630 [Promethearchaeota archaeon]